VTHAAAHDGGQPGALLDPDDTAGGVPPPPADGGRFANRSIAGRDRSADAACRSAADLDRLARRGRLARLQRAKPKGKPMPSHIRRGNARRGKVRGAVEHLFAAQKQRLRPVVRTIGLARATAKLGLANLAYDLPRFTWLQGRAAPARLARSASRAEPTASPPPAGRRNPDSQLPAAQGKRHDPKTVGRHLGLERGFSEVPTCHV
jgi:hypothetical protein